MKRLTILIILLACVPVLASCITSPRTREAARVEAAAAQTNLLPQAVAQPVVGQGKVGEYTLVHRQMNDKREFAVSISPVTAEQDRSLLYLVVVPYVKDTVCAPWIKAAAILGKSVLPLVFDRAPYPSIYDNTSQSVHFLAQCLEV